MLELVSVAVAVICAAFIAFRALSEPAPLERAPTRTPEPDEALVYAWYMVGLEHAEWPTPSRTVRQILAWTLGMQDAALGRLARSWDDVLRLTRLSDEAARELHDQRSLHA